MQPSARFVTRQLYWSLTSARVTFAIVTVAVVAPKMWTPSSTRFVVPIRHW